MGNIDDRPLGAVENGAVFMDRIERDYEFSCEAGSLTLCSDWIEFRRCFEVMADYIRHKSTSPAPAADLKAENERLREALSEISKCFHMANDEGMQDYLTEDRFVPAGALQEIINRRIVPVQDIANLAIGVETT